MPERRLPERMPLRPRQFVTQGGAQVIQVPHYAARQRLDAFLARDVGGKSRSEWQNLIELGVVTLDGRPVKAGDRVGPNQRVVVGSVPSHVTLRPAENIPLTVLYEDPTMIVLDKPAGLVVHPAPGHEDGTLVNALLARFPELRDPTGQQRPGIVHRLDKDTSGVLVIGKTVQAMAALQDQFRQRTAVKRYLLLVRGNVPDAEAAIDVPIGRDQRDRQRMAARNGGRESRTEFTVLERFGTYTLVEASLLSGRTHQLRVHFQFIGHPVAGDATYGGGGGPSGLRRQFVHAAYLRIRSPHDGEERQFQASLPPDLAEPLDRLRGASRAPGRMIGVTDREGSVPDAGIAPSETTSSIDGGATSEPTEARTRRDVRGDVAAGVNPPSAHPAVGTRANSRSKPVATRSVRRIVGGGAPPMHKLLKRRPPRS